jgi:hypothetical protein
MNDRLDMLLGVVRQQAMDAGVPLSGCTEEELQGLEAVLGHHVPQVYRRFMLAAGKNPGPALAGTDCTFPTVLALRKWAEEILEEAGSSYALPEDAFVFSMHQGYEFLMMRLGDKDDPPVCQYVEGDEEPVEQWGSFSDYLCDAVSNVPQPGDTGKSFA